MKLERQMHLKNRGPIEATLSENRKGIYDKLKTEAAVPKNGSLEIDRSRLLKKSLTIQNGHTCMVNLRKKGSTNPRH